MQPAKAVATTVSNWVKGNNLNVEQLKRRQTVIHLLAMGALVASGALFALTYTEALPIYAALLGAALFIAAAIAILKTKNVIPVSQTITATPKVTFEVLKAHIESLGDSQHLYNRKLIYELSGYSVEQKADLMVTAVKKGYFLDLEQMSIKETGDLGVQFILKAYKSEAWKPFNFSRVQLLGLKSKVDPLKGLFQEDNGGFILNIHPQDREMAKGWVKTLRANNIPVKWVDA